MKNLELALRHFALSLFLLARTAAVLAIQPGSLDTAYQPVLDGPVKAIAVMADGKALIGGTFATVNGSARAGIVRLNADGTLDSTFDPGPGIAGDTNRVVNAILVQPDGKVLLGGVFAQIHGVPRVNLARLNANGSVDMSFAPACHTVNCLALQPDGGILYGGQAGKAEAGPFSLGRLSMDGTPDSEFRVSLAGYQHGFGDPIPPSVDKVVVQTDGRIFIQGFFNAIGPEERFGFARLNANGSLDTTFPGPPRAEQGNSMGPNCTVASFAVQPDGKVLLGSTAFLFKGWNRRLARLDANGLLETNFSTPLPVDLADNGTGRNAINCILPQTDGHLLVSGDFTAIVAGGQRQARNHLVRLIRSGGLDYEFGPNAGTDTPATVMVSQRDGRMLLGGAFTNVNGTSRPYLARLHGDETLARVPTILTPPSGTNVLEGETVGLWVSAAGAALRYQWRRNGIDLAGATRADLVLTNVNPADSGDYAVTVRNEVSEAMSAPATVTIHTLAEALNSPGLNYTTEYGSKIVQADWIYQTGITHDGVGAIQTQDAALTHPGEPWPIGNAGLQTKVQGPGQFSFWWKSVNSLISFSTYVDGVSLWDPWFPAPTEWRQVKIALPPGEHTLEWYASFYSRCALVLDEVSFTPGVTFSPAAPHWSPHGGFEFQIAPPADQPYQLEWSADLIQWTPWMTITPTNSILQLYDPSATNRNQTFYRARVLGL